jgi:hypothetical protein
MRGVEALLFKSWPYYLAIPCRYQNTNLTQTGLGAKTGAVRKNSIDGWRGFGLDQNCFLRMPF